MRTQGDKWNRNEVKGKNNNKRNQKTVQLKHLLCL